LLGRELLWKTASVSPQMINYSNISKRTGNHPENMDNNWRNCSHIDIIQEIIR
jgi:hypothetical protein